MLTGAILYIGDLRTPIIFQKSLGDYQQLCKDRNNGRIFIPDGIRLICEAYKNDLEAIGKHKLETLIWIQNKERY